MPRGVLVVSARERGGKLVNICMIDEVFSNVVPGGAYDLDCNSNDAEFVKLRGKPPAVRQAGEKLYSALVAHQPVRDFFAQTREQAAGSAQPPVYPLYIRVDTPDAEELPWEILCETQKSFMVLDPQGRWPISRLASVPKRAKPLHRNIGNELRLAVVLAAACEDGATEWASISGAISKFNTPVDVLVLVSEDDVKERIAADALAWASHGTAHSVEVDFVGDSTTLMTRLCAHVPNAIHFFCHGNADVPLELELETRSDRRAKKDQGSIKLDSRMLALLAPVDSLWLVVLNCCHGAKSAPPLHSLAHNLVKAGIPAVVAMRESVAVNDANLFAEHFYRVLLTQLQGVFALRHQPAPPDPILFQEIVWVRAVHQARLQLSLVPNRPPDTSAEWTYPVLYVDRDELMLHPRKLKPATLSPEKRLELETQIEVLRAIRASLEFATDANAVAQRTKLDVQIQMIEAELASS